MLEEIIETVFADEDLDLVESILLEKKKWIQDAIKKEGSLRKTMKTKKGETIPVSKLEKAAKKGGKTGKRARLALTLRKLNEESGKAPPTSQWIWGRPGSGIRFPSQGYKDLWDAYESTKDPVEQKTLWAQINAHPHHDEFIAYHEDLENTMRGGSPRGSLGG